MKNKISLLIGVAALVLAAVNVQAQNSHPYALTTVTSGFVVGAAASSPLGTAVDCSGSQVMSIAILPALAGGCTNEQVGISATVDGLNFDTNHWVIGGLTAGTWVETNITVGGFQQIRFDNFTTVGTLGATNQVKTAQKLSSP